MDGSESGHVDAERISAYLGGDLPEGEARALEGHLAGCAHCAGLRDEILEVIRRAGELEDRSPSDDLWPGIARALEGVAATRTTGRSDAEDADTAVLPLEPRRTRRRLNLSVAQAVAASVILALASGAAGWMAHTGSRRPGPLAEVPPTGVAATATTLDEVDSVAGRYAPELARLEAEFRQSRGQLDPATIVVLEKNLAVIDRAIRESRRALEVEPGDAFLKEHLARAYRTKVQYLQEVTQVTSRSS